MSYIRIVVLNLVLLSFSAYSMQPVVRDEQQSALCKPSFLTEYMMGDIWPQVMVSMDYASSIQWIQTCKYFYNHYSKLQDCNDEQLCKGRISLSFNDADCSKALFYYACQDQNKARALLQMHEIKDQTQGLLSPYLINAADSETCLGFYQQKNISSPELITICQNSTNLSSLLRAYP